MEIDKEYLKTEQETQAIITKYCCPNLTGAARYEDRKKGGDGVPHMKAMRASVATQYFKKLLKHPNEYYKQIAKIMQEEYMSPMQMTTKGPRHWKYLAEAMKDNELHYWATAFETIAEAQINYTTTENTGEIQIYGGGTQTKTAAIAELKLLRKNPVFVETCWHKY